MALKDKLVSLEDLKVVGDEVADLRGAIEVLEPAATEADVGKALIAKTVADGKVTEYEFGEAGGGSVSSDVEMVLYPNINTQSLWQEGYYGVSQGLYSAKTTASPYCCTIGGLPINVKTIICPEGYEARVQGWTYNGTYKGGWSGTDFTTTGSAVAYASVINIGAIIDIYPSYVLKLVVRNSTQSTIDVPLTAMANVIMREDRIDDVYSIVYDKLNGAYDYTKLLNWEVGTIITSGGSDGTLSYAIRTPFNKILVADYDIRIISSNPLIEKIYAFKYNKDTKAYIERITNVNKDTILPGGYLYRFVLFASDSTTITSETIPDYSAGTNVFGDVIGDIYKHLADLEQLSYSDCVIDSAMHKTPITLVEDGQITYKQSFCIYNGYFYSIEPGHIAKQDSSYALISDGTISVGHGNAFQLGHNGVAYASGWDDQSVYIVDLGTMSVIETITLPTTGYTTCAVDDLNKLVYIFQRDSRPNTVDYYNFIVYDYDNEQVVSSKVLPFAMASMQAVDIIDGKIIVLNGAGTSAMPNGYRILTTDGVLLSEFVLASKANIEPEGVCIDRESKDIYISYNSKYVYKIKYLK